MKNKLTIFFLVLVGIFLIHGSALAQSETAVTVPWAWYISRATGLMTYLLLWWVMFFGLAIRTPLIKNIFSPGFSLETHRWLSVQVLFFVFVHSGALLFDKFIGFQFLDLIMPFHSQTYTTELTLGILGAYLMIILILTSYFREFFSPKIWRAIHWLNIIMFALATLHAFLLGTDLHTGIVRNVFIVLNIILAILIAINLATRLKTALYRESL